MWLTRSSLTCLSSSLFSPASFTSLFTRFVLPVHKCVSHLKKKKKRALSLFHLSLETFIFIPIQVNSSKELPWLQFFYHCLLNPLQSDLGPSLLHPSYSFQSHTWGGHTPGRWNGECKGGCGWSGVGMTGPGVRRCRACEWLPAVFLNPMVISQWPVHSLGHSGPSPPPS